MGESQRKKFKNTWSVLMLDVSCSTLIYIVVYINKKNICKWDKFCHRKPGGVIRFVMNWAVGVARGG